MPSEQEITNAYDTLELKIGSDFSNVRKQFLTLARLYHPDKQTDGDSNRFREIYEAYEVLKQSAPHEEADLLLPEEEDELSEIFQEYDCLFKKGDTQLNQFTTEVQTRFDDLNEKVAEELAKGKELLQRLQSKKATQPQLAIKYSINPETVSRLVCYYFSGNNVDCIDYTSANSLEIGIMKLNEAQHSIFPILLSTNHVALIYFNKQDPYRSLYYFDPANKDIPDYLQKKLNSEMPQIQQLKCKSPVTDTNIVNSLPWIIITAQALVAKKSIPESIDAKTEHACYAQLLARLNRLPTASTLQNSIAINALSNHEGQNQIDEPLTVISKPNNNKKMFAIIFTSFIFTALSVLSFLYSFEILTLPSKSFSFLNENHGFIPFIFGVTFMLSVSIADSSLCHYFRGSRPTRDRTTETYAQTVDLLQRNHSDQHLLKINHYNKWERGRRLFMSTTALNTHITAVAFLVILFARLPNILVPKFEMFTTNKTVQYLSAGGGSFVAVFSLLATAFLLYRTYQAWHHTESSSIPPLLSFGSNDRKAELESRISVTSSTGLTQSLLGNSYSSDNTRLSPQSTTNLPRSKSVSSISSISSINSDPECYSQEDNLTDRSRCLLQ